MFPELYTAASGMVAGQRTIDLVSNNLANARTAAFRADRPLFASYVAASSQGRPAGPNSAPLRGVQLVGAWRSDEPAPLRETGAPLDVALAGRGWFRVETPGGERLTRNGAFTRADDGRLLTSRGEAVLGASGQPLVLPDGEVVIARDGTIELQSEEAGEEGTPVGRFGIADAAGTNLVREGETLWRAEGAVAPLDDAEIQLAQGYLEESGVSATEELVSLIAAQRLFEMQQKVVDAAANQVARQALSLAGVR